MDKKVTGVGVTSLIFGIVGLIVLPFVLGILAILFGAANLFARDSIVYSLSLKNVVDLAISQSSAIKYAQNRDVNYYWRWKNHQTRFRPQLVLAGNLPDFENQTKPITQPDGSIELTHVTQLQTSAQLALSQPIPQLGAYVYAASGLVRLQDFNNNTVSFSGVPVSVGITQPLFAYNWMKWSRQTEPLVYEEAQIYGKALVHEDAQIYGKALVYEDAQIYGKVLGEPRGFGDDCETNFDTDDFSDRISLLGDKLKLISESADEIRLEMDRLGDKR